MTSLDPRRAFSAAERNSLYVAADGRCTNCGFPLTPSFHGDHETPHALGGATDVINGRATCPNCNQSKGAAILASTPRVAPPPLGPARKLHLRGWQRRLLPKAREHQQQSFLLDAAPGSGKTVPSLKLARELIADGLIDLVVVIVPRANLTSQWAAEAEQFGMLLDPAWSGNALRPDVHGACVTYQRLISSQLVWRHHCGHRRTLVIADEAHHLSETAAWGSAFRHAFEHASRWLLLSGTPFRSDGESIPGVSYDEDDCSIADFGYSYADAVRDGVCRKLVFVPFDGIMRWLDTHGTVTEASFSDPLPQQQHSHRHRTALSTAVPQGIEAMLTQANQQLTDVRTGASSHPDAGGLVVCSDIEHARAIGGLLQRICGERPTIVTSEDPEPHKRLRRFAGGTDRWLLAVGMVSEGADIPRLRVGVYATVAKTELLFRQIAGRFVRLRPGLPLGASYVMLPADPQLVQMAQRIEREADVPLATADEDRISDSEQDGSEPKRASIVPLEAPLHARGALMGGEQFADPEIAGLVEMAMRKSGLTAAEVLQKLGWDEDPLPVVADEPAHERRQRLRQRRNKLAARVGRETGSEYRDVNQRINDAVAGGTPVADQTDAQLEDGLRMLARMVGRQQRGSAA